MIWSNYRDRWRFVNVPITEGNNEYSELCSTMGVGTTSPFLFCPGCMASPEEEKWVMLHLSELAIYRTFHETWIENSSLYYLDSNLFCFLSVTPFTKLIHTCDEHWRNLAAYHIAHLIMILHFKKSINRLLVIKLSSLIIVCIGSYG